MKSLFRIAFHKPTFEREIISPLPLFLVKNTNSYASFPISICIFDTHNIADRVFRYFYNFSFYLLDTMESCFSFNAVVRVVLLF